MLEHVLGRHVIAEFKHCDSDLLNDKDKLLSIFIDACIHGGAGIIGHIEHKFTPQGVTILILLSESHLSYHSWPERGYAMIDACTCGDHVNPGSIIDYIHTKIKGKLKKKELDRGEPFDDDTVSLPEHY